MPRSLHDVLVRVDRPTATVDDGLIVYDPAREQAHLLNHSAAEVWLRCDGERQLAEVVDELADDYGVDAEILGPDVLAAATDLADAGILLGEDDEDLLRPPPGPYTARRDEPPEGYTDDQAWAVSFRVEALGDRFGLQCADEALGRFLHAVLSPLRVDDARTSRDTVDRTYRIWPTQPEPPRVTVASEHEVVTADAAPADAASTLLWHYNHEVIERTEHLLLLHSSAVATEAGVVALPAVANSGKSTLATLLTHAGYRYLTDEALAIDPDSLVIHPYPKPIGLDPGSFPLFPDLEPSAERQPPELFHQKWWLDPAQVSPHGPAGVQAGAAPLQAIVFPTYEADTTPSLEPVAPAEGVVLLARNTFNLKRWGQRGLDLLVAIATSVPLYRMTHNDLDATLELIRGVVGPPPGTDGAE